MLRISPVPSNEGTLTLLLEGRLLGPWILELESAVASRDLSAEYLNLDLSGLQFVDAAGVDLLLRLKRRGIRLEGISPFISELLACGQDNESGLPGASDAKGIRLDFSD